jgi:D-proline reductase (dithiol) PrdB
METGLTLPPGVQDTLQAWVDDTEVRAALDTSDWKSAFAKYTYLEIQEAPPFARLNKPLSQSTIAVVTTGGLYIDGKQSPFNAADVYGDASIRLIPADTPNARLKIAHDHYDHTVPEQDLNTINPMQNLLALAAEGLIGAVASPQISAHGYIPLWTRVIEQLIPAVVEQIRDLSPDGVLLVPV